MRVLTTALAALGVVLSPHIVAFAQPVQAPAMSVPRVIKISGEFRPSEGQRRTPIEVVTVAIYAEETGGAPLWEETQTINMGPSGSYTLLLGATTEDGVPMHVFAGEARWIEMTWARPGEQPGPRTRLTSVPYALRASDAETLGGKPASAYQLAPEPGERVTSSVVMATAADGPSVVNPGTVDFLAKYVNGTDVGNSNVYESSGRVGVNTATPRDIVHSSFTNTDGALTGFAVQNLGNTATSYSGMLFYDQNGATAQFQGFNNVTHEYRINNIARNGSSAFDGSINFMVGSTSRLLVTSNGNIGIGVATPANKLVVAGDVGISGGGDFRPLGTIDDGVRWVNASGAILAHMHRWGAGDDRLYVTNASGSNLTGVYLDVGATSWTSTSDERLKSNIEPVTGLLGKIKNIRVVGYDMALLSVDETGNKVAVDHRRTESRAAARREIGSIAQDWLPYFPELVVIPKSAGQHYGLNYDRIGVVALGAVKELDELVARKDAEIQVLSARITALEQLLQQLMAPALNQLQAKQQ